MVTRNSRHSMMMSLSYSLVVAAALLVLGPCQKTQVDAFVIGATRLRTAAAASTATTTTTSISMGMGNSYGRLFRISTWGESHGGGVGVTVDGCPPRIPLAAEDIQVGESYNRVRWNHDNSWLDVWLAVFCSYLATVVHSVACYPRWLYREECSRRCATRHQEHPTVYNRYPMVPWNVDFVESDLSSIHCAATIRANLARDKYAACTTWAHAYLPRDYRQRNVAAIFPSLL